MRKNHRLEGPTASDLPSATLRIHVYLRTLRLARERCPILRHFLPSSSVSGCRFCPMFSGDAAPPGANASEPGRIPRRGSPSIRPYVRIVSPPCPEPCCGRASPPTTRAVSLVLVYPSASGSHSLSFVHKLSPWPLANAGHAMSYSSRLTFIINSLSVSFTHDNPRLLPWLRNLGVVRIAWR